MTLPNAASRRSIALAPAFVAAFSVGAVTIVLAEVIGDGGLARLLGTAGPLLAMLGYLVVAWQGLPQHLENSREQVADSVYFMGFMFTLLALSSALFAVSNPDTEVIVSRFSLALSTTLLGLMVKVLMTQFGRDVENRKRRLDDSLVASMTTFQRQLDTSAILLGQHVEAVNARIEGLAEASCTRLEGVVEAHQANAQQRADAFAAALEARLGALADRADAEGARVEARARALDDEIECMLRRLAEHVDAAGGTIEGAGREVAERMIDHGQKIEGAGRQLADGLSKSGDSIEAAIGQVANRLDAGGERIETAGRRAAERMDGCGAGLEALAGRLKSLEALLGDEQRRHEIDARVETMARETRDAVRSLAERIEALVSELDRRGERTAHELARSVAASSRDITESIRDHRTESVDLDGLEKRLVSIGDNVNELAGFARSSAATKSAANADVHGEPTRGWAFLRRSRSRS